MIRKLAISASILFLSAICIGQSIEVNGGYRINHLFDMGKDEHIESIYNIRNSFIWGVGISALKIDFLTFRFELSYFSYDGKVAENYSGLAGRSTTEAHFSKSLVSLHMFPLSFFVLNKFELNFGLFLSGLIKEEFSGTISGCYGNPNGGYDCYQQDLEDKYNSLCSRWAYGFEGRISYDFLLSESLILSPSYTFSFGISDEFSEELENTNLMGHTLLLGIKYKIDK